MVGVVVRWWSTVVGWSAVGGSGAHTLKQAHDLGEAVSVDVAQRGARVPIGKELIAELIHPPIQNELVRGSISADPSRDSVGAIFRAGVVEAGDDVGNIVRTGHSVSVVIGGCPTTGALKI